MWATAAPARWTRPGRVPRRRRCHRRREPEPRPRVRTPREIHVRSPRPPAPARRGSALGFFLERPDLDRNRARPGGLTRPLERSVEVRRLDDPEAADVLLPFDEGAVGDEQLAVLEPHHGA